MPSNTEIAVRQLQRLVGTPDAPALVDVRLAEDLEADPRLIPGSVVRDYRNFADWAGDFDGRPVVVICQKGRKLSQGVAALLRCRTIAAETLDGGFEAWRDAGGPLLRRDVPLRRDPSGRSLWVTRARPKVDRIACPWLIRRFVDGAARFLFVDAAEVEAVAERFEAIPFDIEGVFWSHRGEACTFDTMLTEFGLASPALDQMATIIRAADTARLDLAPQASGFLAVSLGLSRMYRDDLAQLEAGLTLYDALFRWCRDAADETHNWPTPARTA